jgi:hypothetical protein
MKSRLFSSVRRVPCGSGGEGAPSPSHAGMAPAVSGPAHTEFVAVGVEARRQQSAALHGRYSLTIGHDHVITVVNIPLHVNYNGQELPWSRVLHSSRFSRSNGSWRLAEYSRDDLAVRGPGSRPITEDAPSWCRLPRTQSHKIVLPRFCYAARSQMRTCNPDLSARFLNPRSIPSLIPGNGMN